MFNLVKQKTLKANVRKTHFLFLFIKNLKMVLLNIPKIF